MGATWKKEKTRDQKKLTQTQQDLLATQEAAASLVVDGLNKDAEILDLKELVANVIITTGGVV